MRNKPFVGREMVCPVCGKDFLMQTGWLYKRLRKGKSHVMCSWPCLKAWDEKNSVHYVADPRERMIQAINDGLTDGEIMVLLGETAARVARCRKRLEDEHERKASAEKRVEEK